ncbi:MAG: hypothetical protein ABDH37_04915 [Candidatus Hydrothermales bacterium]
MKLFFIFLLFKSLDSPLKELLPPDSFDFAVALISDVGNNFEPCGCGNPPFKGGELSKRVYLAKKLHEKYNKKILIFDTGNYVSPSSNKEFLKIFKKILKLMRVKAMALGQREAFSNKEELEYLIKNLKYPYINMNSDFKDLLKPYEIFHIGKTKIYFTSYNPKNISNEISDYESSVFEKFKKELKNKNSILFIVTPFYTELPIDTNLCVFNIIGNSAKFEVSLKREKGTYILTVSRYGIYLPVIFFSVKNDVINVKKVVNIPLDEKVEKDSEVEKLRESWEDKRKREIEEMRKKFLKSS